MVLLYLYLLLTLVIGIMIGSYGKKLYFPVIMLISFFVGFKTILNYLEPNTTNITIAIVVGLLIALLVKFIHKLGLIILGGVGGYLFASIVINITPLADAIDARIIQIIFVVLFAILSMIVFNFAVRVATSLIGATMVSTVALFAVLQMKNLSSYAIHSLSINKIMAFSSYLYDDFVQSNYTVSLLLIFIFFILFLISQFKNS